MEDNRDLPVSNERLTGELKAAVFIVIFGFVALGVTEALDGKHDTPAGAESAAGKAPALCEIPGKPSSVLSEIGPLAPVPRAPCPAQPRA